MSADFQMTRRAIVCAPALAWLGAGLRPAQAQAAWPQKPAKFVVGYNPGGVTDVLARMLARGVSEASGRPVIVENKPGAGGNIAAASVARAAPDGLTLFVSATGNLAVNQYIYSKLAYDPARDFTGVALIGQSPILLVVHPSLPVKDLQQLLAYARANPGKLSCATGGNGTTGHMALELLKMMAAVNIVHVPYNGSAPARNDLLGGQVQMSMSDLASYQGDVKSGTLRAIATGSSGANSFLPDVPSISDAGLPGYAASSWYALVAPAATPGPILSSMSDVVDRVLHQPAMAANARAAGAEILGWNPEKTRAFISAEAAKWKQVVSASGARIE